MEQELALKDCQRVWGRAFINISLCPRHGSVTFISYFSNDVQLLEQRMTYIGSQILRLLPLVLLSLCALCSWWWLLIRPLRLLIKCLCSNKFSLPRMLYFQIPIWLDLSSLSNLGQLSPSQCTLSRPFYLLLQFVSSDHYTLSALL